MALREVIQLPELNRPNERYIFIGSKDGDLWYAVLWFYFAAAGLQQPHSNSRRSRPTMHIDS